MTTPRIEGMVEEFKRLEEMCDDDSDQMVAMYRRHLGTALTQAHQAGIDEAVEIIKKNRKEKRNHPCQYQTPRGLTANNYNCADIHLGHEEFASDVLEDIKALQVKK